MTVVGIWGHSNSGKTRLVEQLIPHLGGRGRRVGTVKHASCTPTLDTPGKDSWRHGEAGAARVLLLGPGSASLFVHDGVDPELDSWLGLFAGQVDILLVEGFKRTPLDHVQIVVADDAAV